MIDRANAGPERALEQGERRRQLQHLVEELPREKREVFRMVFDAEMEIKDVAEFAGRPARNRPLPPPLYPQTPCPRMGRKIKGCSPRSHEMDMSAPWHRASFDLFIYEKLPQLLASRLPLSGYRVTLTSETSCRIDLTLGTSGQEIAPEFRGAATPRC